MHEVGLADSGLGIANVVCMFQRKKSKMENSVIKFKVAGCETVWVCHGLFYIFLRSKLTKKKRKSAAVSFSLHKLDNCSKSMDLSIVQPTKASTNQLERYYVM